MAKLIVLFVAAALAGCSGASGALVNGPGAALAYQRGMFAGKQTADGQRGFTFTIPANAYDGNAPKDQHEKLRLDMLAGHVGQQQACPGSYKILSRQEQHDLIYYEGVCA